MTTPPGDKDGVIRQAFMRAEEKSAHKSRARRDRPVQDILHDDVPTFMELPLATKPQDLVGADAAIMGFGYEGITIVTPSLSAPPTISRPEEGSVYWRMGSDKAPDAIRRYSIFYSVHHNHGWYPEIDRDLVLHERLKVVDYGNVEVVPSDTDETLRRGRAKVGEIVKAGAFPIVLGGDHTTPIATLSPILEGRAGNIGVICLDAHMDLSYTEESWASVEWAKAFELGKVRPENLVVIGVRSNRNTQFEREVAAELGVRVITIDEAKKVGMEAVISEAIEIATRDTDGVYVSVDIDCMEPSMVPGQKAPEIWGLTIDEYMQVLRALSRLDLVGFDICELTPDYDVNGISAQFCARSVVEILAGLALRRRD
jgi:arginase family enzyme